MQIYPKMRNVMVVDDERVDQILYERVLRKAGMFASIVGFIAPDQALDYLGDPDRPQIDVILLDVNMPGQSGYEFLEAALDRYGDTLEDTIVLMVSSLHDQHSEQKAEEFTIIKQLLHKPLIPAHLRTIEHLLVARDSGAQPHVT